MTVDEYRNRLEPLMAKLEMENIIESVKRRDIPKYAFCMDGVLFELRVKNVHSL